MISLAVMAIVMVGIYRLQAQSIDAAGQVRFYAIAPFLARQILTDIERQAPDDIMEETGTFGEDYPELKWQVRVDEIQIDTFGVDPVDVKRIHVVVSRSDDERSFSLSTYRIF